MILYWKSFLAMREKISDVGMKIKYKGPIMLVNGNKIGFSVVH